MFALVTGEHDYQNCERRAKIERQTSRRLGWEKTHLDPILLVLLLGKTTGPTEPFRFFLREDDGPGFGRMRGVRAGRTDGDGVLDEMGDGAFWSGDKVSRRGLVGRSSKEG